jgi:antitoxin component YwqK of YwqJK toxin-antitoxin module
MQANCQLKSYLLLDTGDTLNRVDNKGMKQGRWKIHINALRTEPAYDEEGIFKNDAKEGLWRIYDNYGLLLAQENYKWGNKNGLQQYLSEGRLEREENWRSVDPERKFDTIDVPDVYDQYKIETKIIKVESYGLPCGVWKYYDPEFGRIIKTEHYDAFGNLYTPKKEQSSAPVKDSLPKKIAKPKAVEEFEKGKKGKKSIKVRDGMTG